MARFDSLADFWGADEFADKLNEIYSGKQASSSYTPGNKKVSSGSSGGIFDFLEGIDNIQKPIFYGIGSGIDAIGDLTLGNLLGLFDENLGKNFKESTTGETYSWLPSSAADIATWFLPGGVPLKLGLLGLKGLAESSKNLKSAATGVDAETGEKLSGAERAGQGLMGALNTALTVLPGAPIAKAAEKSAAKSLVKQSEKNLTGSQIHDLRQLKKQATDPEAAFPGKKDLPEGTQITLSKNGEKNVIAKPGTSQKAVDKTVEKAKTQIDESISNLSSLIDKELGGKLPGMDEAPKFAGQNWELRTNKAGDVGLMPVVGTADKQSIDLAKALANDSFFPTGSAFQMRRLAAQGGEKKKGLRNAITAALKGPSEVPAIKGSAIPSRYGLSVEDVLPQGKTPASFGLKDDASIEQVYKAMSNPRGLQDAVYYGRQK